MSMASVGKFLACAAALVPHPMTRRSYARHAGLVGVALCALIACGLARADWVVDGDAGLVHDSNLTRAANGDAIRGDYAWTAYGSLGYAFVPASSDTLTLAADIAAERYGRYRALDHVALGVRAFYRHKLGLGSDVPYLAVALAASRDVYRDDPRDSDRADGYVELGRRFDATFDTAIGGGFDRRLQRRSESLVPGISGNVFDLRGRSAWWRTSYALTGDVELGARVSVRRGDVESTAHQSFAIFRASDAIAEDSAFGDDELYAYRLRGTTWTAGATLSWALSSRAAINGGYADERTRAAEGLDYRSRVVRISLSYRL